MSHLTWSCACGRVEAEVPTKGNRIVCYCESCREFVTKLGSSDRLLDGGGSELFQVLPQAAKIIKGAEHLAHFHLTKRGPLRWYATCCNTPMVNTLATRNLPFASFQVHDLEPKTALPPVRAHVNLKGATKRVEGIEQGGTAGLIVSLLANAAKTHLTGKAKLNPFFDAAGAPIGVRAAP